MILITPKQDAAHNRYIERFMFALRDRSFHVQSTFIALFLLPWSRFVKKADAIMSTTWASKIMLTLPARALGLRVVWLEDALVDRTLSGTIRVALYRLFARFATIIVAADIIKRQLKERGVPEAHIRVIYPGFAVAELGVQATLFDSVAAKRKRRQAGFSIGAVATLDREKGVEHLLQGFKIAHETIAHLHLTIIGNGPKKQELKWTANALGIDDHVLFVGWQDQYERFIQGFDLFVMPHARKNRWSHALLAAMAYKKPIVVTNVGVFPEVIERKQTGIIIEPENPSMIAEAIISLHANAEWRADMGQRAHDRVVEHFSFNKMAEELKSIF